MGSNFNEHIFIRDRKENTKEKACEDGSRNQSDAVTRQRMPAIVGRHQKLGRDMG